MKVPFTWKVTGWFMVGWSAEFPVREVRPLKYFGEDLVAYRDESGAMHILTGHCRHLGAHIGYGGTVVGDCVECPFHGWRWGPDGTNRAIPGENRTRPTVRLRVYPVVEHDGCVFMWHHPGGEPPSWEMPDIFLSFPQFETDPAAYYPPYPTFVDKAEGEPVHPQVVLENAPDSVHFEWVHRASVTPVAIDWRIEDHLWKFVTGWPDVASDDPDSMALRIHSHLFGLGGAISAFEGAQNHRLVFTTTPVEHGRSDLFYTVWWPREPGDDAPAPPPELRAIVEKQFMVTMWDDLEIWRYQKYVEHPALAQQDARPYGQLRKWAKQFYEIAPGEEVEKAPA